VTGDETQSPLNRSQVLYHQVLIFYDTGGWGQKIIFRSQGNIWTTMNLVGYTVVQLVNQKILGVFPNGVFEIFH
jgi:hypothetical protein